MNDAAAGSVTAGAAGNAVTTSSSSSLASLPFRPIVAPLVSHRVTAVALSITAVGQVGLTMLHLPGLPCPFLGLTGVPCPGCGLSRACATMLKGDVQQSLHLHAFALPVLLGMVTLLLAAILPARARLGLSDRMARLERGTGVSFLLLAGAVIYWLGRLVYARGDFISLIAHH